MRRSRLFLWATPTLVVLLAAGVAVARGVSGPGDEPATAAAPGAATATLTRQDLTSSVSMAGQLGYGTPRTVKGGRPGIVTWLPAAGTVVERGAQLYRVDDKPVPLFYGGLPLFRTLAQPNMVGRDVRVVLENLKALGYPVGRRYAEGDRILQTAPSAAPSPSPTTTTTTVRDGEDVLTAALMAAVKRWQDDVGLPVTGVVGVGDVAVLGDAVRVESLTAATGDPADAPLMTVTPIAKAVTVQAELAEAGTIQRGDAVTVRLPDDRTAGGKVSDVAGAVRTDGGDGAPPTLTVTVALDDPAAVAGLDAAPVQVEFPATTVEDVLAAPVGALLALSEGGYAVQVVDGPLVAVRTGMFAGGMVEISGDGLAEGTRVVSAS